MLELPSLVFVHVASPRDVSIEAAPQVHGDDQRPAVAGAAPDREHRQLRRVGHRDRPPGSRIVEDLHRLARFDTSEHEQDERAVEEPVRHTLKCTTKRTTGVIKVAFARERVHPANALPEITPGGRLSW